MRGANARIKLHSYLRFSDPSHFAFVSSFVFLSRVSKFIRFLQKSLNV